MEGKLYNFGLVASDRSRFIEEEDNVNEEIAGSSWAAW